MKKILLILVSLLFLNGCSQYSAMVGPSITLVESGSVLQATTSYGSSYSLGIVRKNISEELKANVEVQSAIKNGFSKAFSTIIDANITTLLVAVILYSIGTGPIKGFAVTLSIGIITSVFTAIFVTRSLVNFIYGYREIKDLKV